MKIVTTALFLAFTALSLPTAHAQAPAAVEAAHNELRALRAGLLEAMNKGDIEAQLTFLHPNAVVTWHNAEVSRGRDGVRAYYNKLISGPEKMVEKFTAEIVVDELTIFHGETTGISFGSSVEHFKLTKGSDFDLNGRWSATLVKENGKWLIANLHASTNIFDNALLDVTKKYAVRGALIAAGIAAFLGWFVGKRRRPRVV